MVDSNGQDCTMATPAPTSAATPADPDATENPLEALLGYQLRRASAAFMADLAHALADLGLNATEASILLLIGHNPGITQSDIGRILAIKRANMAPIAASLSARGLIDRDRPDGRSQGLRLNDAGLALARAARRAIDRHEARFLPDLSADARDALIAVLKSVWTA